MPPIAPSSHRAHRRRCRILAAAAAKLDATDTKFVAFWQALQGVLDENRTSKVIVFTTFRKTIAFLERELRRLGVRPVVLHGDVKPEDRNQRIGTFREEPGLRVMLTTEVGVRGT